MPETVRHFRKRPEVKVQKDHPYNAETPPDLLRGSFITPTESFYVRSHGDVPDVDAERYVLKVTGLVERPLELSLETIRSLPKTEFVSTLYCAGNRRAELMERTAMPGKVAWNVGAAGNARWGGVLLRDVLAEAGVRSGARHAAFTGLDLDVESGTGAPFGGSVPIEKATSEDVLLAYEMNGEALAPEHGYPLRVVVGGYIGARSVKWLSEISLQEGPSENHYQAVEYRLFPPHVTAETADSVEGETLGELPLNAVICTPQGDDTLEPGRVTVRGYALAASEIRIEQVQVSPDGGETWTEASLTEKGSPAAWRFWEADLELGPGRHEIVARAADSGSGVQPETVEEIWNYQGYANNAWHRVSVRVGG
jgi:sulfite oxidase